MRRLPLLPIALCFGFAPTVVWMVQGWFAPYGYFGHGPLLVLAGLVFGFERRRSLRRSLGPGDPRAAILLLGLLALHLAAVSLQVDSLSGALLVPVLFAYTAAHYGMRALRVLAAPLGCLLFAVPLPLFVTGKLAYELKHAATEGAVWLGNLGGLGLRADGARILVPGQSEALLVGDACSGLRSLVSLLALGYVYAFFLSSRSLRSRFLFLAYAALLALLVNLFRLTLLAWIAGSKGTAYASGPAHDLSNLLLYPAAILFLLLGDRILPGRRRKGRKGRTEAPPPPEGREAGSIAALGPGRHAAVAGLCLAAGLLGWIRPEDPPGALNAEVPRRIGPYEVQVEYPLSERWYGLLGTRDVCWRAYRRPGGLPVVLTVVFHGRNWKAVHPPETCLQASGYEVLSVETRSLGQGRPDVAFLRAVHGRRRLLGTYLYGGRGFETPSYTTFFLANAPRALLRLETRGYLLRAEVLVGEGVEEGRATAELRTFLLAVLPEIRRLVSR